MADGVRGVGAVRGTVGFARTATDGGRHDGRATDGPAEAACRLDVHGQAERAFPCVRPLPGRFPGAGSLLPAAGPGTPVTAVRPRQGRGTAPGSGRPRSSRHLQKSGSGGLFMGAREIGAGGAGRTPVAGVPVYFGQPLYLACTCDVPGRFSAGPGASSQGAGEDGGVACRTWAGTPGESVHPLRGAPARMPARPAATARQVPRRCGSVPGRGSRPCAGRCLADARSPRSPPGLPAVPGCRGRPPAGFRERAPGNGPRSGQTVRPGSRTGRHSAPPANMYSISHTCRHRKSPGRGNAQDVAELNLPVDSQTQISGRWAFELR